MRRGVLIALLAFGLAGVSAASSITGLSSVIVGSHRIWVPAGGLEWSGMSLDPFYGQSNHLAERLIGAQFPGSGSVSIWNPTSQTYFSVSRTARGTWMPTNVAIQRARGFTIQNAATSPPGGALILMTGLVPPGPATNSIGPFLPEKLWLQTVPFPVTTIWGDLDLARNAGTNARFFVWDVTNQAYALDVTNSPSGWGAASHLALAPQRGFWFRGASGVTQTWMEPRPYAWPSGSNDLQVLSSLATNNTLRLTIGWPSAMSGSVWDVYSADPAHLAATNYSWLTLGWTLADTNIALTGTPPRVWTDSGQLGRPNPYQVARRYYAFGQPSVDTDGDGLSDALEWLIHQTDADNPDTDGDGLTDGAELNLHGTDPLDPDTDGDGMPDGWEVTHNLEPRSGLHASLAGWWRFDETNGAHAANSAGTSYHGELIDMGAAWTTGKLGGALSFSGISGFVQVAQSPAIITGQTFTASAWAYLDPDTSNTFPTIIADYMICGSGWEGFWLGYEPMTEGAAMLFGSCISVGYPAGYTPITGRWVHVVGSHDGTTVRLYLDGQEIYTENSAFTPAMREHLYIGWDDDPLFSLQWKGRLDDIRLYTTALTSNQVATLYDAFADADGDGYHNLAEYQAGADPNVFDPSPQIVITYPVHGGILP